MATPVCVISGDIHYNLNNLQLADISTRMAIHKANELNVPFIANGDVHDSKANLRGECVNAMIETFKLAKTKVYLNIGNHDKINEKSDEHSLNFLAPYVQLITKPTYTAAGYVIPYQHDLNQLKEILKGLHRGDVVIMHQGITESDSGEYIMDKTAITKNDVAGLRVVASHYHKRQTIELPDGGLWDYVGSPYSTSFGEANDPPKGFQILMDNGSLEFVPTNLRKHVVIEMDGTEGIPFTYTDEDLIWVKLTAKKEDLKVYTKKLVGEMLGLNNQNFKLDLIPLDTVTQAPAQNLTQTELLDKLIDSLTNTSDEAKVRLKQTWKELT